MSLGVGVSLDGVRVPVSRARVADAARAVLRAHGQRDAMLSITFVSAAAIRRLNRRHLKRDRLTDVIAFAFRPAGRKAPVVGDIYIAPGVARTAAVERGIPVREEIVRLVVHGTLHVLGHDHPETDARSTSKMWRLQERLVARLVRGRA
jgi:probable rRNA maturation factor